MAADLTAPSLEKGSFIKFAMASSGRNCIILSTLSPELSEPWNCQYKNPLKILSIISQTNIAPTAKADRFTRMPKNNPKEKKPTNFIKKATKYSKSETIIANSL